MSVTDQESWKAIAGEYDSKFEGFNAFYPVGHYMRYGGFAFVANGKVYVGGASASSYHPNSHYELYMLNR